MVTFQIEPVEKWSVESRDLTLDHWHELGLDLDLEAAIDFSKMKAMEDVGMFKIITVRDEGVMVGYLLAVVSPHLHYSTSAPMFIVDMYYIAPAYRNGTGVKLIRFAESLAKELGTIKIYLSCKVHRDHTKLFQALGYKLSDYAFIKRI
jgi:hypothetical protein